MENILTKIETTTTTWDYNCSKWKDNSTRNTPGQLKCEKWEKTQQIQVQTTRQQNQKFIDQAYTRMNYIDYFITIWIILLFLIIIIKRFLFK